MVTLPWPRIGGASGKGIVSDADPWETLENIGFRVCACVIAIAPLPHANGYQSAQTVTGNPLENVVKQRRNQQNGKAGKVSISWKTMASLLGTVAHHFTEECSMQCGNLKLSCTHM